MSTSDESLKPQEGFEEGETVFVVNLDYVWTDEEVAARLLLGHGVSEFEEPDVERMRGALDAVGVGKNSKGEVKEVFGDGRYRVEFENEDFPDGVVSLDLPKGMLSRNPVEDEHPIEEQ